MKPEPSLDFPYAAVCSLCVGVVANCIVFTAPLPYLAFMVVDFGVTKNLDSAGYSAGWIAGIFMIGRLISGVPFGVLADNWGRRYCLIISMINIGVLGVLFGLSTNYPMALITRCLCGIGNGFMGVVPTVITELTNDKEHETKAFGLVNGAYGIGFIVGPVLGGLLARPAAQYSTVVAQDSLWGMFPYLLPSLACSLIAVIALVLIVLFVPETLKHKEEAVNISIEMTKTHEEKQYGSLSIIDDSTLDSLEDQSTQPVTPLTPNTATVTSDSVELTALTLKELLQDPQLFLIITISFLFSCFAVMIKEVFPLWCVSSRQRGGMQWSSSQVGLILCCVGIALVVFQIFLYAPLMSLFKNIPSPVILHHQIVAGAVPICLLPVAQFVAVKYVSDSSAVLYVVVVLFYALHNILIVTCYSSLAMIINASVSPGRRCTFNGFTATASSLGNFAAPVIGSNVFALFDSWQASGVSVVDGRLVFVLCGILLMLLAWLVKCKLSKYYL